jgi:hypothetical protein
VTAFVSLEIPLTEPLFVIAVNPSKAALFTSFDRRFSSVVPQTADS